MSTAYVAPGPLTPILTNGWGEDRSWTLDSYRARGGYQATLFGSTNFALSSENPDH